MSILHPLMEKQCCELGKEKPDSVPRARGTSRPKMGKPTVLLTSAKVTQERVDYSTNKPVTVREYTTNSSVHFSDNQPLKRVLAASSKHTPLHIHIMKFLLLHVGAQSNSWDYSSYPLHASSYTLLVGHWKISVHISQASLRPLLTEVPAALEAPRPLIFH